MNYRVNAKQEKQNKVKAKWMDHDLLFRIKDNIVMKVQGQVQILQVSRLQIDLISGPGFNGRGDSVYTF